MCYVLSLKILFIFHEHKLIPKNPNASIPLKGNPLRKYVLSPAQMIAYLCHFDGNSLYTFKSMHKFCLKKNNRTDSTTLWFSRRLNM